MLTFFFFLTASLTHLPRFRLYPLQRPVLPRSWTFRALGFHCFLQTGTCPIYFITQQQQDDWVLFRFCVVGGDEVSGCSSDIYRQSGTETCFLSWLLWIQVPAVAEPVSVHLIKPLCTFSVCSTMIIYFFYNHPLEAAAEPLIPARLWKVSGQIRAESVQHYNIIFTNFRFSTVKTEINMRSVNVEMKLIF